MLLVVPLWNEDQLRPPVFTFGLVLFNLLVFLIAWPLEQRNAAQVGRADISESAHQLADILVNASRGVAPEEKALLLRDRDRPDFPSLEVRSLFAKVEERKSFPGKEAYEWRLVHPHFEALAAGGDLLLGGLSL